MAASVLVMALALWLLRLETATAPVTSVPDQEPSLVFIEEGGNQAAAVADAIGKASSNGSVTQLIIDDVVLGNGDEVVTGDVISVHYTGSLQNGQQFDSSYDRGQAFNFTIGEGRVIKGWDEGLLGMKVGGKRILVIPPEYGYGAAAAGPIPPNSTLVFAVELVAIQ